MESLMSSRDPNDDKYERLKNDLNDVKKFQNILRL